MAHKKHNLFKTAIDAAVRNQGSKAFRLYTPNGEVDEAALLDRSSFITSSQISRCEREIYFQLLNYAVETEDAEQFSSSVSSWGFFERGDNVEEWINSKLDDDPKLSTLVTYRGDNQASFCDTENHVASTPDGLMAVGENTVATVEFKSIDPRIATAKLPKPEHIDQVLIAQETVAKVTGWDVTGTHLLYVNASKYDEMFEYFVEYDYDRVQELYEKAERILSYTAPEQAAPEGIHKGQCVYCGFKAQCSAITATTAMGGKDKPNAITADAFFGKAKK